MSTKDSVDRWMDMHSNSADISCKKAAQAKARAALQWNQPTMWSEAKKHRGNTIQRVVTHHLENNIHQHSCQVKSSDESQTTPEFFKCRRRLIARPCA